MQLISVKSGIYESFIKSPGDVDGLLLIKLSELLSFGSTNSEIRRFGGSRDGERAFC